MTSGKRLTIGVTVNLERYENLRVTVEGDVDTLEDAKNLACYLDGVLAGLGKNDPETERQIANYRFRVLSGKEKVTEGVPDRVPDDVATEAAKAVPDDVPLCEPKPKRVPEPDEHMGMPVQSNTDTRKEVSSGLSEPKAFAAPTGPTTPAGLAAPAAPAAPEIPETGFFCADCGVTISKQEHKLGRLFVDRPLCRSCLETLQKTQH